MEEADRSTDLIAAMYEIAQKAEPITGRGVGYKLFTQGLIASMARNEMQKVYRLLKEAREEGVIPWDWIVDETRTMERVSTWADPQPMPAESRIAIAATSGTSSQFVSRSGPRRHRSRRARSQCWTIRGRLPRHAWLFQRHQRARHCGG